jgi:hypothetical protein
VLYGIQIAGRRSGDDVTIVDQKGMGIKPDLRGMAIDGQDFFVLLELE